MALTSSLKRMKKETLARVAIGTVGVIAGLGAGLAGIASAQGIGTASNASSTMPHIHMGMGHGMMDDGPDGMKGDHGRGHGVMGTVTAVSGTTITITGKDGKTYTIDASSAQIGKIETITAGDVHVGDTLGVEGTLSGTNVTAKHIMDGIPSMGKAPKQQ